MQMCDDTFPSRFLQDIMIDCTHEIRGADREGFEDVTHS
jgi:hypothetical protein